MLKMLMKFSVVGISGVVVNLAVYSLAIFLGAHYLSAAVISFVFAVTNNFFWNFIWTFKGKATDKSLRRKYVSFFAISLVNFAFNILLLKVLVEMLACDKIMAQLVAIGIVSCLNFIGNYKITFAEKTIEKEGVINNEIPNHHTHL